jgi:hypothetical protein
VSSTVCTVSEFNEEMTTPAFHLYILRVDGAIKNRSFFSSVYMENCAQNNENTEQYTRVTARV